MVFADGAVDGDPDGTTRRQKGVVAEGKFLTEKCDDDRSDRSP